MGQQSVCKFVCLCAFPFLISGSAAWGQVRPRMVEAVSNDQRITLKGNVHPLARAEFDRGAVVESQPMTRMLLLLKRGDDQEAALRQYLDSQQDKSSPNYHAWLTPAEFGTNYGPADADVQAVTDWLTSQGFTVEKVYSGKTVIEFSGTAGGVQGAFGTAIRNFEIGGKTYVANASDPQIPAALAPVVAGVVSLNNFPRKSYAKFAGVAQRIKGKAGLQPLFTFPNPFGSGTFYGMAPGDFATIYNTAPLLNGNPKIDGTGQTIAIVGETNIQVTDVQAFRQMFGLPANFDATNVILNGEDPGITSTEEEGEADLDVEWSGAVAPGATVKLVVSASTLTSAGIDLSALYIVEHNLAAAMSESYGGCESSMGSTGNAFYNSLWEQAAAQGITVMVSAGDNGSAGCDDFDTATAASQGLAVSGIASTPYNVAVGGTDFDQVNNWSSFWNATNSATGTSALSYIPEIPWNESCAQIGLSGCGADAPQGSLNIVAGSGGPSSTYSKPNWQLGVTGMPNDSHRDLPDVSMFASSGFDGTGYLYCQGDHTISGLGMCDLSNASIAGPNFGIVGGTSASSPAFAGIMALVNQYEANNGGTNRQGNANNVLYALAKKAGASCTSSVAEAGTCIFNDVTKGNSALPTGGVGVATNSVPCTGGTLNCSSAAATVDGVLVDPANSKTEAWTAGAGYDMATGLGSVNVKNLATQWGTVNSVATATTLALSPATGITHGSGENVNVNITVTPTSATGSVSLIAKFTDGTTEGLDQFTLASGKVVNGTTNSLPGGTYTVTAHYAGDGTNAPSDSAAVNVTVAPESSQTFVNLVTYDFSGNLTNYTTTSTTYGSGYNVLRVDVGDESSSVSSTAGVSSNCSKRITNCPTGTITMTTNGTPLAGGNVALNNEGYAVIQNWNPGSYAISASYPGDASYQASAGSTNFTITKAGTTINAGYAGTPVQYGNQEQVVANIFTTSFGVAPTGTFVFYVDGAAATGPVPVYESGNGAPGAAPPSYSWGDAQTTVVFLSVGNHTLSATYSGDANYAAATSATVTVNVTKEQPTIGTWGATPGQTNVNQPVTLTVQMYGSDAGVAPTGTMTFYDGGTALTGVVTYTSGTRSLSATMPYTPTTAGTHPITVTYSGDGNYQSVSSPTPANLVVVGPDFTLTPQNPTSVSVNAGTSATFGVAIAGTDGFASAVTVTCSLQAAATTCGANPASVLPGNTTTITVTTTAHQLIPPTASDRNFRQLPRNLPLLILAFLIICLLAAAAQSPRRRVAVLGVSAVLVFCSLFQIQGCGGGGGTSTPPPPVLRGTQPGSYSVTITGSSGSATHSVTVTLSVN
jgi:pro-kumamolisin-like protein/Big-like domain-containing protein